MIKTSVVRQVSVDDVRGIPHLVAVGMMVTDIFAENGKFDCAAREDFINLINNYTMHCNPDDNSVEYFIHGHSHKNVTFYPAGLDGIKIVYHLDYSEKITTWNYDDYAELSGEWENMPDDDEDWFE